MVIGKLEPEEVVAASFFGGVQRLVSIREDPVSGEFLVESLLNRVLARAAAIAF